MRKIHDHPASSKRGKLDTKRTQYIAAKLFQIRAEDGAG